MRLVLLRPCPCTVAAVFCVLFGCSGGSGDDPSEFDTASDTVVVNPNDSDTGVVDTDTGTGPDTDTGPSGETCEEAVELEVGRPWLDWGWGFHLQKSDDLSYNNLTSCTQDTCTKTAGMCIANNAELVFKATMLAGQGLKAMNHGSVRLMYRMLDQCSPAVGQCLISEQVAGVPFEWTAPEDGEYYLVVEMYSLDDGSHGYSYSLNVGLYDDVETNCDDGIDNDGDGLFDCLDEECQGSCAATILLQETFDIDLPVDWSVTGAYSSDPSYRTWHWCDDSKGYTEYLAPTFCIQGGSDGLPDVNNTSSHSGAGYVVFMEQHNRDLSPGAFLQTPQIDVTGYQSVALSFAQQLSTQDMPPAYFEVQVSTDGTQWKTVRHYGQSSLEGRYGPFVGYETIDLSDHLSEAISLWIRFHYNDGGMTPSSFARQWELDDITVLGGSFAVHGAAPSYAPPPQSPYDAAADACDGGTVCESLAGHEFGDCSDSLGYFYNGVRCEEAIGCAASTSGYCFYNDAATCAASCSEKGMCNVNSFIGPNWSPPGEAISTDVVLCTTAANWTDIEGMFPAEITFDPGDVSDRTMYFCPLQGLDGLDAGASYPRGTTSTMWRHLCAFSLTPGNTEIISECDPSFGCPGPSRE